MRGILTLLSSPGLALGTILFMVLFVALAAWLPERGLGTGHPFRSVPFLSASGLLWLSTLACTWGRTGRMLALWRGDPPAASPALAGGSMEDQETFLHREGFRPCHGALVRFRSGLWGGWLLHLGLLVLMAGIGIQQAFHDEGTFLLTEGGGVDLRDPAAVEGRSRGPLAPIAPPALEVVLAAFDPALHQEGYAPDRFSRLIVRRPGGGVVQRIVDRARGAGVGGTTLYQAIPTGLALVMDQAEEGLRSVHLRGTGRHAEAEVTSPSGAVVRFRAEGERALDDPMGTGALIFSVETGGKRIPLNIGDAFDFGGQAVRLKAVARWGAFTYTRSPGMPAVFAGFLLVLAGSALLLAPAGVARWDGPGGGFRLHLARGADPMLARWRARIEGGSGE